MLGLFRSRARTNQIVFTGIAVLILTSLILFSPVLLVSIAGIISAQDWERLSYVGQTYGAVATVLTALSLGVIAWSVQLQIKTLKIQLEQEARKDYIELTSLALHYPDLISGGPGVLHDRPSLYAGLWITQWRALFVLGYMPEAELRMELESLFHSSPAAIKRWELGRSFYFAGAEGKLEQRFFQIADELYLTTRSNEEAILAPKESRMRSGVGDDRTASEEDRRS